MQPLRRRDAEKERRVAARVVARLLRGFDVFVLPSKAEGISNTILEAMANKIPVVASRVGGNPELIGHERSGLLFESQNAQTCAHCILNILDNHEQRKSYISQAYENVIRNHSMESMYQKNAQLYSELIQQKFTQL